MPTVPVSSAFGYGTDFAVETLAAIDRIHQVDGLPRFNIGIGPRYEDEAALLGSIDYQFRWINVHSEGPHLRLTLAHEIGHLIDTVHGFSREAYDDPASPYRPWLDAVWDSTANRDIVRWRPRTSGDVTRYLDYLLQPDEIWARCYAQFIASRSANVALTDELDRRTKLVLPPGIHTQWFPADFVAIRRAMERIFQGRGWM